MSFAGCELILTGTRLKETTRDRKEGKGGKKKTKNKKALHIGLHN